MGYSQVVDVMALINHIPRGTFLIHSLRKKNAATNSVWQRLGRISWLGKIWAFKLWTVAYNSVDQHKTKNYSFFVFVFDVLF